MKQKSMVFFLLLWAGTVCLSLAAVLKHYSAEEVRQFLMKTDGHVVLLDVRTPEEYGQAHLTGSTLLDYHDEDFEQNLAALPRDVTYIVFCATGYRSIRTARMLQDMGYEVIHMDGGIEEWKRLRFPVVE